MNNVKAIHWVKRKGVLTFTQRPIILVWERCETSTAPMRDCRSSASCCDIYGRLPQCSTDDAGIKCAAAR